ncbi:hypothetical protein Tco_1283548 [Tanacetum coccineum]
MNQQGISCRSGDGRGRLAAASANRVFGLRINRGGIGNGGGRDMPNMCGSVHGRGGNFGPGRGKISERGCGRGPNLFTTVETWLLQSYMIILNFYLSQTGHLRFITPFTSDMSAAGDGIVAGVGVKGKSHIMETPSPIKRCGRPKISGRDNENKNAEAVKLLSYRHLLKGVGVQGKSHIMETLKAIEQLMARNGTDLKMAKLLSFKLYVFL